MSPAKQWDMKFHQTRKKKQLIYPQRKFALKPRKTSWVECHALPVKPQEATQDIVPLSVGTEGHVSSGMYGKHGWRQKVKKGEKTTEICI